MIMISYFCIIIIKIIDNNSKSRRYRIFGIFPHIRTEDTLIRHVNSVNDIHAKVKAQFPTSREGYDF